MKAKVIETGEIIDVCCLYPTTYSRLDCNCKIIEEYCDDELELILPPKKKTILIEDAIKWFKENLHMYNTSECTGDREAFIEDFKKHFDYESNT
jgi:hypothetical protein